LLLQDFINTVAEGSINLNIDKTFKLYEIIEAHTYMKSNQSKRKIVVEVE